MEPVKRKGGVLMTFGIMLLVIGIVILLVGTESEASAALAGAGIGLVLLIIGLVRRSNSAANTEVPPTHEEPSGEYRGPRGERTKVVGSLGSFFRATDEELEDLGPAYGGERGPAEGASRPTLEGDLLRRAGTAAATATRSADGVSMDQKYAAATGNWVCPQCETINAKENATCLVCGFLRGH